MILTAERLREVLRYDPDQGEFTWRKDVIKGRGKGYVVTPAGSKAGWVNDSGYIAIKVDGVIHLAHRLAFLHMTGAWPFDQIDHIDLDRSNNKWANLRPATQNQNQHNRAANKNNRLGVKGVTLCPNGKYRAQIKYNGHKISVGYFDTLDQAADAYALAAQELHEDFHRTGKELGL